MVYDLYFLTTQSEALVNTAFRFKGFERSQSHTHGYELKGSHRQHGIEVTALSYGHNNPDRDISLILDIVAKSEMFPEPITKVGIDEEVLLRHLGRGLSRLNSKLLIALRDTSPYAVYDTSDGILKPDLLHQIVAYETVFEYIRDRVIDLIFSKIEEIMDRGISG